MLWTIRIYMVSMKILRILLEPIFWLYAEGFKKSDYLPPLTNELLKISAVDLAAKIRRKEVKSYDVVRAYITRIKQVNPFINAVIQDRFEDAIFDAQKADKMCEELPIEVLEKNYPLLGLPFTVKGCIDVEGLVNLSGAVSRLDKIAKEDAPIIKKLKAAGGIPLLVSSTPELCAGAECGNLIYGDTLNPYDSSRSSGGSSGGEGALLGCGASLFGIGSDVGGSIRIPSLFNGCFGHKPTPYTVPVDTHVPNCDNEMFGRCLVLGPLCRFAKDVPFIMSIISDEKQVDKLKLNKPVDIKDIKIYYKESMGTSFTFQNVDQSIRDSITNAAANFKEMGLQVENANTLDLRDSPEILTAGAVSIENLPFILEDRGNVPGYFLELFKSIFGRSKYTFKGVLFYLIVVINGLMTKAQVKEYLVKNEEIRAKMLKLLGTNGVLLYPTFQCTAFRHFESALKFANISYCALINMIGFPAIQVPCGVDKNGLPTGFQVISAPFNDRLCFAVAAELEKQFGGFNFHKKL